MTSHGRLELSLKARGALLGAACGDALGAPFEGMPTRLRDDLTAFDQSTAMLRYTDDTAMTIGLAESLIEVGDLDEDHLATVFARHWRAEPWRGYGRSTFGLLQSLAAGASWRTVAATRFGGQGSWGNGAAMRVTPVALFAREVHGAMDLARRTAVVTHAHPLAIDGAAVQAGAIALAMETPADLPLRAATLLGRLRILAREGRMADQLARLADIAADEPEPAVVARQLGNGVDALSSVPAAIAAALLAGGHTTGDAMEGAIRFAIAVGGDTDTIASMAGAIVGAHLGAESVPQAWIRRLEGADRLIQLADRLASLAHSAAGDQRSARA